MKLIGVIYYYLLIVHLDEFLKNIIGMNHFLEMHVSNSFSLSVTPLYFANSIFDVDII